MGSMTLLGAGKPPVAGGGADAATTAWIAAVVSAGGTVSGTQQGFVDTLIKGLKTDSLFSAMDRIWLYASENAQQASIDIVNLATHSLVNAPSFTASQGYTGNGTSSYINTGFTPSVNGVNYTQNSASFGTYIRNNRTTGGNATAMSTDISSTAPCRWQPHWSGSQGNFNINDGGFVDVSTSTAQGFWGVSRTGSSATAVYLNSSGTAIFSGSAASSGLASTAFFVLAGQAGGAGDFSADQIAVSFAGAGLSSGQWVNFQSRINAYMTSLTTNVY
jgi:hypothetical protein